MTRSKALRGLFPVLAGVALVVVASCAPARMTSLKDPALAQAVPLKSVGVVAEEMGVEARLAAEEELAKSLRASGINVAKGTALTPPGDAGKRDRVLSAARAANVDAVLFLTKVRREVYERYIPPHYYYRPYPWYGYPSYRYGLRSHGYWSDGYTTYDALVTFRAELVGVDQNRVLWIGETRIRDLARTAEATVAIRAADAALRTLTEDGVLKPPPQG